MAKTYSPKKFTVTAGPSIITGYAEDSFITVERNADQFALLVGADGEGARAASANKSGRITLRLIQTSASNDALSGLMQLDELTNFGQFPVFVKDLNGATVASAAEAWIVKWANIENGSGVGEREWIIETADLQMFVGGNL